MSWNPLIHDCEGCARKRGQPCVHGKADVGAGYCGERLLAADRHRISTMQTGFVIEASQNPLCYDCSRCSRTRGQPCMTRLNAPRRRGYCDERMAAMAEAVSKSRAARTRIVAVLPWSCGVHQTTYADLDATKDQEGMLRQAWGQALGSQYVSRIIMTNGIEQFELWNERDGWHKEMKCETS